MPAAIRLGYDNLSLIDNLVHFRTIVFYHTYANVSSRY
jgi:hypothetical protein